LFQGNNVKDESYNPALFEELSSSPATLQAMKCVDAYGAFPGNATQQCDAEQAYIQAKLKGTPTWVRLPKEHWPPEWRGKYKDPVVKLNLALYGHPDSGGGIGKSIVTMPSRRLGSIKFTRGEAPSGTIS